MPAKSRHGGRRPGAGAPIGNLNGLSHGLRSRQLRELTECWARDPRTRHLISAFTRQGLARPQMLAAIAIWLRYIDVSAHSGTWDGPPPPRLSQRALNLLAKTLAKRAIKEIEGI